MTKDTLLPNGSSTLTTPYVERNCSAPGFTYETSSGASRCQFYNFEDYVTPVSSPPPNYTRIGDLVSRWEKDAKQKSELEDARRWLVDAFHGEEGDSIRTLRLRKGWSQTHLAKVLKTSQSHVARIERGTENISIETCRKLSDALGVDLNTLDKALRTQEALAHTKVANK